MKTKGRWTASAAMFSGRRDPVWTVSATRAAQLVRLWGQLDSFRGSKPVPPPLGYRGCYLESPEGERWEAFGGVVRRGAESKADPEEVFEKTLLKTARVAVKKSG